MKKIYIPIILLALIFIAFTYSSTTNDENLEDTDIILKHLNDTQNFEQWYHNLKQRDKNLVLAGTVYFCRPDFTKAALLMGGDVNTQFDVVERIDNYYDSEYDIVRCKHRLDIYLTEYGSSLAVAGIGSCENSRKTIDMLKLLIENGSIINKTDSLETAIRVKEIKTLDFLLQNGADFNKPYYDNKGIRVYAFSSLIDIYIDICSHKPEPLYVHSPDGSIEVDRNSCIEYAQTEAIWNYVITYLQNHKLSPEAETDAYIHAYGNETILKTLNLKPDYRTTAAKDGIIEAAWGQKYDLLKQLIDNNVDINYQDASGRTALYILTHKDNPNSEDINAAKYLLEHGININIKEHNGQTAFDNCSYQMCLLNPNGMPDPFPDDDKLTYSPITYPQ